MKTSRYLLRTINNVTIPLLLALTFWAVISGYRLPPGLVIDFSSLVPDFSFLKRSQDSLPDTNTGAIYQTGSKVTQAGLHGLAGWEGVDIQGGCGASIYSPIDGRITYNGLDGYVGPYAAPGEESTMLTITGDGIEFTLLHGDYVTAVGEKVKAGEEVGKENKHGNATGCHSHVIMRVNNRTVNYLTWLQEETSKHNLARRSGETAAYALRLSHYDTSFCYDAAGNVIANTNCDSDPTTMASGDKVASWIGGKGGTYAAACPQNGGWQIGDRFSVAGVEFTCRDHGGFIQCYEPGQVDKAIASAHSKGYLLDQPAVVEQYTCWIDAMVDTPIAPYGTLTFDWEKH